MAHRSPKSCGGRCKHILSVAVPYSAMTRNQQCELGVSLTMSKWNTNHLPSALKVPFPSITLAHHPEEHGTASTPLHEELLSKLAPNALGLFRWMVVWSLLLEKGSLAVLTKLLLSSGFRQSPNSPLERHLKHRFTAPVGPQHKQETTYTTFMPRTVLLHTSRRPTFTHH